MWICLPLTFWNTQGVTTSKKKNCLYFICSYHLFSRVIISMSVKNNFAMASSQHMWEPALVRVLPVPQNTENMLLWPTSSLMIATQKWFTIVFFLCSNALEQAPFFPLPAQSWELHHSSSIAPPPPMKATQQGFAGQALWSPSLKTLVLWMPQQRPQSVSSGGRGFGILVISS